MPGDYGCRLDDNERAGPVRLEPAEGDPEDPVARSGLCAPLSSKVDRELLAQGRVLERQSGPWHQNCPQPGE